MTDREKLIEYIKQATILHLDYLESIDQKGLIDTDGKAKFIADYLLANGNIIVLPCEVGDKVYFIQDKKVYEGIVVLIRPFVHKDNTTFHGNVEYQCEDPFYHDGRMMTHQISVVFQEYGSNTVAYLTKEEAEKVLENLKNTK